MRTAKFLMVFVIGLCLTVAAFAQDYPSKQVTVIVPYTEGSATDVIARIVSKKLSELWGQSVVVENRAGAGGTTGAGVVAKAPSDGYTLLISSSSHVVAPALYATLPYDPQKSFVDIAPLARQPFALVVGPTAGVKSVSELIAMLKAKPGQLKFGSAGTGSAAHLVAEKFKSAAGIDVAHVPFKGGPEANADTIAGKVTFWFPPVAMSLKPVKEGKLLALGVTSAKRASELPDVPTIAEAGLAGFEDNVWWGIWAPAGIPDGVANKLAKDVARAIASPDLREQFTKQGFEPMSMTSEEFAKFVRNEMEAAARIAKAAGIKPQ
ncbi:MAG: tripartite tricarboxylate transporter substrate binding protein [Nitrospirota bacterium]